eukprot:6175473-Pleurochrysis_carterae.AAC.1
MYCPTACGEQLCRVCCVVAARCPLPWRRGQRRRREMSLVVRLIQATSRAASDACERCVFC